MLHNLQDFCKGEDSTVEKEINSIQPILDDPTKTSLSEQKLNDILKKYPETPRIYLLFGEFYNRYGNYEKAVAIFKKGLECGPNNPLLYWGLGIAYEKQGMVKFAINNLEKALECGLEKSLERYARVLIKTLQKKI